MKLYKQRIKNIDNVYTDGLKKCLKCKNEKGITLIALLITIIVLIILAAISIKELVENNFIKTAMDSTENFAREEQKEITHINDIDKMKEILGNKDKIEDKEAPKNAEITLDKTFTESKGNITAAVLQTDDESGVDIEKCKWVFNKTKEEIGTGEEKYTGGTFSSNPQDIKMIFEEDGEYYLHVLTIDKLGNKKETISEKMSIGDEIIFSYADAANCRHGYSNASNEIISYSSTTNYWGAGRPDNTYDGDMLTEVAWAGYSATVTYQFKEPQTISKIMFADYCGVASAVNLSVYGIADGEEKLIGQFNLNNNAGNRYIRFLPLTSGTYSALKIVKDSPSAWTAICEIDFK